MPAATGYSWTGPSTGSGTTPAVFSSTLQNPIITNLTETQLGTYTLTVTFTGGCTNTYTTAITAANCDVYLNGFTAADVETTELTRLPATGPGTGLNTYTPIKIKLLPFVGTSTFNSYSITWLYNGTLIPGANGPILNNVDKPGTYKAIMALVANPATNCEATIHINAVPCKQPSPEVACGPGVVVNLPTTTAAGVTLAAGDKFTAGDYTIVISEIISGDPSDYTGTGYVDFKMLYGIVAKKIAIDFSNAVVNDCYELVSGKVVSQYDPSWGNVIDVDATISNVRDILSDLREIYTSVYDKIGVLDCSTAKKAEVQDDITGINNVKNDFENIFSVTPAIAAPFKVKLEEISTSLTCKVQATCPSSGARPSVITDNCDFDANKVKFEEIFCEIISSQFLIESTNISGGNLKLKFNGTQTAYFTPSGLIIRLPSNFIPSFGTSTSLNVHPNALVAFLGNGKTYVAKYLPLDGVWRFIGYVNKQNQSDYYRFRADFSQLEPIFDENQNLTIDLKLGITALFTVGTSYSGIAAFLEGSSSILASLLADGLAYYSTVLGSRVLGAACAYVALAWTVQGDTNIRNIAGELSQAIPYLMAVGILAQVIPTTLTTVTDITYKIPKNSGNCNVYVIWGPNKDKDNTIDVAKYGMTCADDACDRPSSQVQKFRIEDNTILYNYGWLPFLQNIDKTTAHAAELALTISYVLANSGILPPKHRLPSCKRFNILETTADQDERRRRALVILQELLTKYGPK